MPDLHPGDTAPDFTLPRADGEAVTLSDLQGPVVLYFYPRDDTPGCTKQAIAFTDRQADFAAHGATILGVSKDPLPSHEKFAAKHDLKIALLSDAEGTVCEDYGVWVDKKMYGKTFKGIERTTFLICDGAIVRVWPKVKVPGHVDEVLDAVKGL